MVTRIRKNQRQKRLLPQCGILTATNPEKHITQVSWTEFQGYKLLWEPYPSHNNGLFSPLLVQRFHWNKADHSLLILCLSSLLLQKSELLLLLYLLKFVIAYLLSLLKLCDPPQTIVVCCWGGSTLDICWIRLENEHFLQFLQFYTHFTSDA